MPVINKFAELTGKEKQDKYSADISDEKIVYHQDGTTNPLEKFKIDEVEFVSGFWRVQNKFDRPLLSINGITYVLGERIPKSEIKNEINFFKYYYTHSISSNCYGISAWPSNPSVAANIGKHWGHGSNLSQAERELLYIYAKYQYNRYINLVNRIKSFFGASKSKR